MCTCTSNFLACDACVARWASPVQSAAPTPQPTIRNVAPAVANAVPTPTKPSGKPLTITSCSQAQELWNSHLEVLSSAQDALDEAMPGTWEHTSLTNIVTTLDEEMQKVGEYMTRN